MPITVRKGTSSKLYKIETESDEHPMRVFLKVSGSIPKIPSATFYPDYVLLWNTSHKYKEFRVGVPIDAVPGTYSLEWTKTGDDYEKDI